LIGSDDVLEHGRDVSVDVLSCLDKAYFDVILAGILVVDTAIQSDEDLLSSYCGRECLMDRFDVRRVFHPKIRVKVRRTNQRNRTMPMEAIVSSAFDRTYSPYKCHQALAYHSYKSVQLGTRPYTPKDQA